MFTVHSNLGKLVDSCETQAEFNQVKAILVAYKDQLNKAIVDWDNRVDVLSAKITAGLLGADVKLEVSRIHAKRGKEATKVVDMASVFMPKKEVDA